MRFGALALTAPLLFASIGARADDNKLAFSLGYAFHASEKWGLQHGVGGGVEYRRSIEDPFEFFVSMRPTFFPSPHEAFAVTTLSLGVTVARRDGPVVPWIGLGVGAGLLSRFDEDCNRTHGDISTCINLGFVPSVPFGLDFRVAEHTAIGVAGDAEVLLGIQDDTRFSLGASGRLTFGW